MRKFAFLTALAVVFGVMSATTPVKAESPVTLDAGIDYASKYVWRGMELNDEPVLQPSLTLSAAGFSLNWWGNYDLTNGGREDNFSEHDWTLSYGFDINETVSVEVGYIEYYFPGSGGDGFDGDTQEAYVSVGFDVLLAPSITIYRDMDFANKGIYASFAIGHSFDLATVSEGLSLDLGASIAYADTQYNDSYLPAVGTTSTEAGFSDYSLSAGLSYPLTESAGIYTSLAYSALMSDNADVAEAGGTDTGNLIFSVGYSVSF